MKHIAKALIAMLIMAALIGPSMALNPQYEIPLSSCSDESADGLLFDRYTYDAGYRVWEMDVTVNGLEFGINEDGTIQYLGEPLDEYAERTITYYIYKVDEFGNIISGTYEGHNVGVNIDPCVIEAPTCEYRFSDWDDNIQIQPPEVNKSVRVSWSVPDSNGDWSGKVYENGVLNRGPWKGNFPIEVVYTEYEMDSWPPVPTGRVIIDGLCEA
jgi:hypothetical protein